MWLKKTLKLPTYQNDICLFFFNLLWNDPATGVMRHADARYDIALDCARDHNLNLPAILK